MNPLEIRDLKGILIGGEWRVAVDVGDSYVLIEDGTAIAKDGRGYGR